MMSTSLGSHMEDRWGLAWVIDDDIVDVVVVYDVRNVSTARVLRLNSFMRMSRRWASASHTEALAIRVSWPIKSPLILTLLCHRIFCKFL